MKKLMFIAAIAVFGLSNVTAQEVQFGAKAGVNFANVSGDISDNNAITSFHIGGVAEIAISEKFSVQPELLYSEQGFKFEDSGASDTYKLGYITLPVLAKFYVAEGFSLEAGPQIGFLLSAKEKFEFDGDSETDDVKDFFEGTDFALAFGAGYKLDSGLNFAARYGIGLSNIVKDSGNDSISNSVFQLSVGFMF